MDGRPGSTCLACPLSSSLYVALQRIEFHMSRDREIKLLVRPLRLPEQLSLGTFATVLDASL